MRAHAFPRSPHRGLLLRTLAVCVLALFGESLGASCSSGISAAPVRAFNRPVSVAFACIDTTSGDPQPLARCALSSTGVAPAGLSMHALVTQESRGEVGAVDLIARTILDSDRRIPGYSFVPVGALPGVIIVPPNHPRCTYVANRGTNDISVIETRSFRATTRAGATVFPSVPLPGSPADMVLSSDESALWVALPEEGEVVRLPILGDCELGDPDLFAALDDGSAVPAGVPAGASVDLVRTCPASFTAVAPAVVAPRNPAVDPTAMPAPVALALDDEAGVLLVGDRRLPMIHRVSLSDGSVLAPIAVGAPVRDLVVTPRVPDTYDPLGVATTFSRYVYAIDEDDGTVMAIEYSDETRADFGAVLPIGVVGTTRPDRIPVGFVARALEMITPSYDEAAPDPREALCNVAVTPTSTPGPSFLRGVFLSVAAADGSVRFVDVYDLDAPCRGRLYGVDAATSTADCTSPTIVSDVAVYIRRHRPRGSSYLLSFGGVTTQPTVLVGAATVPLLANGTAGDGATVPSLSELSCPAHLGRVLGESASDGTPTTTRVCGLVDPFAVITETWSAAWQGALPSTATTSGNAGTVTADTVEIDSRVDYCAHGVIGSADVATGLSPDDPEAAYRGDLLALTGALPAGATDRPVCRAVVGISTIGEAALPVLVPIQRAFSRPDGLREPYTGRLVIDARSPLVGRPQFSDGDGAPRDLTILDALGCYGDQLLTLDVRSQGAYTVVGGRSGLVSRVVRDEADGHCIWDGTLDPLAQGRAFNDVPFTNARIAFQLTLGTTGVTVGNPDVRIVLTGTQNPLGIDLTVTSSGVRQISLPSMLAWSEPMARLYTVDIERRGLVEMTMLPIGVSATRFE